MHRYDLIAKELGITVNKLSTATGIPSSTIKMAKKRDSAIDRDIAHKIVAVYPQFNEEWIISGKGSMLKNETKVEDPGIPYRKANPDKDIADSIMEYARQIRAKFYSSKKVTDVTTKNANINNKILALAQELADMLTEEGDEKKE